MADKQETTKQKLSQTTQPNHILTMSLQDSNKDDRKPGFSPDAALVQNPHPRIFGSIDCLKELKRWILDDYWLQSYTAPDSTPPASIITDHPEIRYDAAVVIDLDKSTFTGLTKPEDLTIVRLYQFFYNLNSDIGCAGIATYGRFPLLFAALLGTEDFGDKIRNLLAFRHVAGLPISLNTTIVDMGDITCDDPSSIAEGFLDDDDELFCGLDHDNGGGEFAEALGLDDIRPILLPYEDGEIEVDEDDDAIYYKGVDPEKLAQVLKGRRVRVYDDRSPIPPSKKLTALHVVVCLSPAGYPSNDDDRTDYQVRLLHKQFNQADIALNSIIEAYIVDIIANREDTANPPIPFQCPNMYFDGPC